MLQSASFKEEDFLPQKPREMLPANLYEMKITEIKIDETKLNNYTKTLDPLIGVKLEIIRDAQNTTALAGKTTKYFMTESSKRKQLSFLDACGYAASYIREAGAPQWNTLVGITLKVKIEHVVGKDGVLRDRITEISRTKTTTVHEGAADKNAAF